MAHQSNSKDSIVGYITHISNENKKNKFFVKFSMTCEQNRSIDGWVFGNKTGILTSPLGLAMLNSMNKRTGIRLSGSLEENNG